MEVLKSGPSNRAVLFISKQEKSGMSYMAQNYRRFKDKLKVAGKMVFVVEDEIDFEKK